MEVFGFDEDELRTRAFALRAEARDKMTGWRGKAIQEILPDAWLAEGRSAADASVGAAASSSAETDAVPAPRPVAGPPPARLQVALAQGLHLRDEHFQNNYFKLALINWQIRLLISNAKVLTISFIAGFSERFLLSAVSAAPTQPSPAGGR
jgi:hypothetical protein